ncbi:ash family protein, partial [Escherichia coli]|nr:ash family protein [Escherichia coli]
MVVQAYSSTVVANSATRFDSLNTNADNRRFPILRYFCVRKPRYARIMVGRDGEASACWFHSCQSVNPVTSCHLFDSGSQVVKPTNEAVTMVNANPCARPEFIWRFYSCQKRHYHFVIAPTE